MTDHFTHDAGPYVLGALSPEDRRAFEEHLEECPQCRAEVQEFAGLPGLLSRLPAIDVPSVLEGAAEPPGPVSVLPALLSRAGIERRSRRRRTALLGVAAALAIAAGSVAVTEVVDRPAATAQALDFTRAAADIPASAEATLTSVPDGTRIDMTCRYEGQLDGKDREYVLRVVPKQGAPQRLGTWPVLSEYDYQLVAVAPLPRDQIALFEVTNATGKTLLTLRP
jgi:anti-sigma factor RsiW